jgi:hypothetical protein
VLNGNARLLQPANAAISNWKSAITDGGPDHSKSLQVLYKMGTKIGVGQTYSFVNIEMHLGSQAAHYNLSNMDSLSFYAGGSGKLIIELIQQNPTGVALQVVASKTISLDANWQPFSIKPSDLNISVGWFPVDISLYKTELKEARLPIYTKAPATWTEMGGMVTIVNFKGTGGTEFWLDQIRLHGVNLGDLVK